MKIDAEKLNLAMARRGLTGKALAERAGMSPTTLSLFKVRASARHDTIKRVADALGVPVEEIVSAATGATGGAA